MLLVISRSAVVTIELLGLSSSVLLSLMVMVVLLLRLVYHWTTTKW